VRRRRTISRRPVRTRHGKTTKPKRNDAPTARRSAGSSTADVREKVELYARGLNVAQKKLDRRTRELSEALNQQKATSEVLRVISNSSIDLRSALEAIAASAARLLDVTDADIMQVEGDGLRLIAKHGPSRQWPVGAIRPINRN
jgi:hypothetical protein